jgi:hypothetical protein
MTFMKATTKQQRSALKSITNSKGRFFGLYTNQGSVHNAQFIGQTDNYITVYDRNLGRNIKLATTSVMSVNIG